MSSIIKRPGFSDRYERSRRQHAIAYQDFGRDGQGLYLQSADLNEMQSRALDHTRRGLDYILQDGRIMDGQYPVVEEADEDHIRVHLPACPIYIAGIVHDVDAATFVLPSKGDLTIGVRSSERLVDDVEDASLKGSIPGTEAYMEEGPARVEITVTWGYSLDGSPDPLLSIFQVRDGVILTTSTNIDFSEIYKAIEIYSGESNGSFVNNGFLITGIGPDGDGKQVFSVSEGTAYVNGRRIVRRQAMRFDVDEKPDLRNVDAEPHPFTVATGGTQTFTVSKSPISSVRRVTIEKETAESVLHGPYTGAVDPLQHSSVTAILEIKQGSTVYTTPADFLLSQGQIDWSPSGKEPSPGSSYTVKYRYNENVEPDAVTRDTVKVTGAAKDTNVLIDYAYKLPRIDAVCMDMSGAMVYVTGVSAVSRPRPPVISEAMIELARIGNDWGRKPIVEQTGTRNMPYDQIQDMRRMLIDVYDLVAQERLKNDVSARDVGAKRGLFVDPLRNDAMRDQGIAQTAAVFGGKMRLLITPRLHEFPALVGIHHLDFTEVAVISQTKRSGFKKINPYQTFTPMPGRASVEPSTDIWTDRQTTWTSPETQAFEADEGDFITGISLEQRVEKIGEHIVQAEFIRTRELKFRLEGFIEAETLIYVDFDGVEVTPTVSGPADENGVITGSFTIPANVPTGSKSIFFEGSAGTVAGCGYVARGSITVEEYRLTSSMETTTDTLPQPVINNTVINNVTNVTNVTNNITNVNNAQPVRRDTGSDGGAGHDPLAQTFTLARAWCLSGIRLMCAKVGAPSNSILVQIRTVEVGLPTSTVIAEAFVPGTDLHEGGIFTARFKYPVFIPGAREYSVVVLTDDAEHSLFVAEIGKIDLDTNAIISEQPFTIGVLLSSSNASTWTVHNEADLWFELLGCRFEPVEKVVPIGAFKATKMSDVIVRAGVEYPDPSVDVAIRLTRPNGEVIISSPSQTIRFDEYIQNETIQVEAVLRGTEIVTPFLFPDVQIIEGELQPTGDYYTRAIDAADANNVLVTFDALLPAGAGVQVHIGMPGNYEQVSVSSAVPLGDGVVEQTYIRSAYPAENLDAQTKIVLTGTPAARPEISGMRMLLSKV
ncbi:hypothetical protein BR10RB9215_C11148 [Brucella sp. 10RB9215]|uniref:DUF4815 domain-containing protein n=1 Tax=Brucella sp. 10RB9215 TaxID=1149953 RepID=UPI00090B7266|nr:DUF4815 domain-containing protein [Brucella sp. 10RB9215]SBW14322.1 hypothetical protein BR10RB9215_C11148 [Brucella sp. 10RB9215]